MTRDAERADRYREVRRAARGWHRAGALDDRALAAIDRLYPDDRHRLGPAFRALALVFTPLALVALWLFVLALLGWPRGLAGASALLYGAGLAVLADVLIGPMRRDEAGIETATGLLAVGFLLGGLGWLLDEPMGLDGRSVVTALLGAATILCGAAAVRWGSNVHALAAPLAFYGFLLQLPSARSLWALAAAILGPLALAWSTAPSLPPRHRRSCAIVLAVSAIALYLVVHIGSWDGRWLEGFNGAGRFDAPTFAPRVAFILGTAAVPLGLLVLGVTRRRRLLIHLGVLLGAASLVTLRFYVHVAPLWVVLTAAGTILIALGLGLRRFLASGPGAERGGFTAEPLFEDPARREAFEAAASVVASTAAAARPAAEARPGGASAPASTPPSFAGGGGASGGGGTTDGF
jgi:hypothetical protein